MSRELKRENILNVTNKGKPDWKSIKGWEFQVKIGDFGLSRINESYTRGTISMTGWGGTPGYWAPEMAEAHGRVRSHFSMDSFAVGVISYVLFTGGIEMGED